jgi:molybdate transport system substrate-binding protein
MGRLLRVVALSGVLFSAGCHAADAPSRSVTLHGLAAASLTDAMTKAAGDRATFSFEGSQQVVAQLRQGAPADLVATASSTDMAALAADHLVEPATTFARNRLEMIVAKGNPKGITSLADLARPDLHVVLAAPEVPAGKYANQALRHAGVVVHPRSLELDVKAAVRRVTMGDADAAIVYVTDVRAAGAAADGVVISSADNVVAEYRIAVTASSAHKEAARQFVASLLSGSGRQALVDAGFERP